MKKLVLSLGFMVVVLAGAVVWLAHELSVERAARSAVALEKPLVAVAARAPVQPVKEADPSQQPAIPATPAAPVTPAAAATSKDGLRYAPLMFPQSKAEQQALARENLRHLTDPAERAEMAAQNKSMMRRTYIDMAKKVGLTADEESRFLDLMTEQQLKAIEDIARCQAEPGCDPMTAFGKPQDSMKQEQIDFLGQDRFDRYTRYEDSLPERRQAYELRTRLPNGEGFSQMEQVIDSIAAERQKFQDEAKLRGDEVSSIMSGFGSIWSAVPHDDPDRSAHRLDSAVEFNRRIHERVAGLLTPAQLEAFEGMQSEALSAMRNNIRNEQVLASMRNAAGGH